MEKEKESELEQRVELLEKVVKALCKGKENWVHDERVEDKTSPGYMIHGLVNEFEKEMKDLDFEY